MQGLIGFSTSKSLIASIIRYFRGSEYSHTFIVMGKLNDIPVIAEAGHFEVLISPLRPKIDNKIELWKIDIPDDILNRGCQEIMKMVGRTYGWFQLIGFIWIWLWDKIGKIKSNPFHNGIICSELVYYFLIYINYIFIRNLTPNETAPDHIRDAIRMDRKARCVAFSDFGKDTFIWET